MVEQQNQQMEHVEDIVIDGIKPSKSKLKVNLPSSTHPDAPHTPILIPLFIPQMIFPNFKHGKQKAIRSSILEEPPDDFGNFTVNKDINQIYGHSKNVTKPLTTIVQIAMINYPPRITHDLQFKMPYITRNPERLTDYQMIKSHQMTMSAKFGLAGGNSEVAYMIDISFLGWWDHYLSETQRKSIAKATKIYEKPDVLVVDQGQSLKIAPNIILIMFYNLFYHHNENYEKNREQLIILRCKTATNGYKDYFLSKLYTLGEPNQNFWKEKYISSWRSPSYDKEEAINYQKSDIRKIIQIEGAEFAVFWRLKTNPKSKRVV